MNGKELIGDFPRPNITQQLHFYGNRNFAIIIPKTKIHLPAGQHSHDSYEFFMPSKDINCLLNNSTFIAIKDHILSLNPGQSHGFPEQVKSIHFISIIINKRYFNNILASLGKEQVTFGNECIPKGESIDTFIRLFIEEAKFRKFGYEIILEKLAIQIILTLLRLTNHNLEGVSNKISKYKKNVIEKAIEIIKEKYDTSISIDELAAEFGLHPHYFIRLFKSVTGKTPYEFILDLKIEKAMELLLIKHMKITDVCFFCGFTNQSHFSSVFRKKVGLSPSEYRKKYME